MPYQYQSVVDNLSDKKDITILTQGKGTDVAVMDSTKYRHKRSNLVNAKQFCCLKEYLTKMQCILRNLKILWWKEEYQRLALSGSKPERFFGTVERHKISNNGNQLAIRPIVPSIRPATYYPPKPYLRSFHYCEIPITQSKTLKNY